MKKVKIIPSFFRGRVIPPPSKSIAHRAIIAAALSLSECCIYNVEISQDISATLECIRQLGGDYAYDEANKKLTINGAGMFNKESELIFDCGESGSTLRFFMPLALISEEEVRFTGRGRLLERPQTPYFNIFDSNNIKYSFDGESILLNGILRSGKFEIDGSVSSQFITGLLFALPLLEGDSEIIVNNELQSAGYVDLTLDVLKNFGITVENHDYRTFFVKGRQKYIAVDYTVEGDFSQAAFFLTAGAIGGDVTVSCLNLDSLQGDKEIIDILKDCGVEISLSSEWVNVSGGELRGIEIDASQIPDLVPILTVLCCFCKGRSRIYNAGRLRLKESDRLEAISCELNKLGAKITQGEDFLDIVGVDSLAGGEVDSWNDHRIAMSLAIASQRCSNEVYINDCKCVNKSYPSFWDEEIFGNAVIKVIQ